jgi:hypothetical protein
MAEVHTSSGAGAQERRGGIVDRVKETATAQLTNQKDRGIDALGRVADAVRSSTQKLREERHDTIAGYVDQAADQIDNWSRRLREKDVNELITDVQGLARRQPAVFIGSAFALGLVGARFLKSSRQQSEGEYRAESSRSRYGSMGRSTVGTVGNYGVANRNDESEVASEAAPSNVDFDSTTPRSATGGTEVSTRSTRGHRSGSRTEQS